MTQRLSFVLSSRDFPEAELAAMILDGEVYRVDECVSPIDIPPSAEQRMAALAAELPAPLTLERRSAAWVWGALFAPPQRHEACTSLSDRRHPPYSPRVSVREVAIRPQEITRFSSVPAFALTLPLRTAMDLARYSEPFGEPERTAIANLLAMAAITPLECRDLIARMAKLPNKRLAMRRLLGVGDAVSLA